VINGIFWRAGNGGIQHPDGLVGSPSLTCKSARSKTRIIIFFKEINAFLKSPLSRKGIPHSTGH
jgi:hypothetical protein